MGIFLEMLVCGDITVTTLCTDIAHHHSVNQIGTLWLHSTWQQLQLYFIDPMPRLLLINEQKGCGYYLKLREKNKQGYITKI